MKITPDVNSAGIRPGGNVSTRSSTVNRNNSISDAKFTQDVVVRMQREKSLVDALAIAQSSRELVQKALNVSSRLMSLASEAIISGRVNMNELAGQMTSINGSMGSFGERVSVPVEGSAVPYNETLVDIGGNMKELQAAASDMMSGREVRRERIEPVAEKLKVTAAEIDSRIGKYTEELGVPKSLVNTGRDFTALNLETAGVITGNPGNALMAQGNIVHENAGRLTSG